jgi:hypothetical protein
MVVVKASFYIPFVVNFLIFHSSGRVLLYKNKYFHVSIELFLFF